MSGNVQVTGLAELEQRLLLMKNKAAGRALVNATNAGARVIRDEMKRLVPVRTRRLQRAIRTFQRRTGVKTGAVAGVGVRGKMAGIARMVEYGTKPHDIIVGAGRLGRNAAKRDAAVALAIGNGKFVRKVRHPGSRPKPFLRPGVDLSWRKAVSVFGRRLFAEVVKREADPANMRAVLGAPGE